MDNPDKQKGWATAKLVEIANLKYGKNLPMKQISNEGRYPVFGANGIIGFFKRHLYKESQILISCRGANSGKVNISPPYCFETFAQPTANFIQ
jgi:type I restriction enzyme, S subunit